MTKRSRDAAPLWWILGFILAVAVVASMAGRAVEAWRAEVGEVNVDVDQLP